MAGLNTWELCRMVWDIVKKDQVQERMLFNMCLTYNKGYTYIRIEMLTKGNHEKFLMIRKQQREVNSDSFNITDIKYVSCWCRSSLCNMSLIFILVIENCIKPFPRSIPLILFSHEILNHTRYYSFHTAFFEKVLFKVNSIVLIGSTCAWGLYVCSDRKWAN